MSTLYYKTDNRIRAIERQRARRAVEAGRARWLHDRPKAIVIGQPSRPPVKHVRRGFGEGILRGLPTYRMPVAASDLAWYEEQAQMEEERMLERRFLEYQAQERLCAGLDF